jgi:hypothetical protein
MLFEELDTRRNALGPELIAIGVIKDHMHDVPIEWDHYSEIGIGAP